MVAQRPTAGVRGDHRGLGQADAVPEGYIGNMGQVDHHPERVHLRNDLFAEGTQAVPMGALGGAVGDGVVSVVRERHIADAQAIEGAQQR